ncbi:hypothetical protein [Moorena producens]|nr:hypothetical protein [Moorena producens]
MRIFVPCSLFPVPYSLFPIPCSLFPVPYSLCYHIFEDSVNLCRKYWYDC